MGRPRHGENLFAFLQEDIEQFRRFRRCRHIAQPVGERGAYLVERQPRESFVEHDRHADQRLIGDDSGDLNEDGAHGSAVKAEHHEQAIGRHPHEFDLAQRGTIESRAKRNAEFLREHAERLGRASEDVLDGRSAP